MISERYSYLLTEIAETDVEDAFDYISNKLLNQRILGFQRAEKEGFENSSHPSIPHKINVC